MVYLKRTGSPKSQESCQAALKSSPGGTGFPACANRLAGAEAHPTELFFYNAGIIQVIYLSSGRTPVSTLTLDAHTGAPVPDYELAYFYEPSLVLITRSPPANYHRGVFFIRPLI